MQETSKVVFFFHHINSLCFYLLHVLALVEVKIYKVWPRVYEKKNIHNAKYI
jgi:hypothetical protein